MQRLKPSKQPASRQAGAAGPPRRHSVEPSRRSAKQPASQLSVITFFSHQSPPSVQQQQQQ
ncbi:hypothetical protein PLESTB_001133400 [Pleodorina starrii]|uniref:Uncharacterized protein n=1 Tax=Pleodorina starrii TaxID=330485 RepID=A0A9W6BQV5_9CHLO|nr:hypothetical protein PLESTM_001370800 [Pleodorina starrii]GLC56674.1 hypothetical protein PLESTB_001133400 [Pleodorina starrii]GLC69061.1 hypothetical protein PLESTF_000775300 [Pleodorina starrii]